MTLMKETGLFLRALFLCVFLFGVASCAGSPPLVEQAKAVEAEKYARTNYALKYAPKTYRAGKRYLKQAHAFYEKRVYAKAKQSYEFARQYFEKAETKARITQVKKGGEF